MADSKDLRRSVVITWALSLLTCAPWLAAGAANAQGAPTREPKGPGVILGVAWASPLGVLLGSLPALFVVMVITMAKWRCPACGSGIGSNWDPKFCPKCGTALR